MKSMNDMHEDLIRTYRNTPKDKDGFPKLRCVGMGVGVLVKNKEEERHYDILLWVQVGIFMTGVVGLFGWIAYDMITR